MTALLHDARYALRQLLRTPGFTAGAVLTLALGIAVNTSFFAIVNAVVFRSMRSVHLQDVYSPALRAHKWQSYGALSRAMVTALQTNLPPAIEAIDAHSDGFRDVIAHIPGRAERVQALGITGGHASVLRISPQLGRFISNEDDRANARVVVISDRLWREWFSASRDVIDAATIRVDGQPFQVIGVAPPGYRGPMGFGFSNNDLWVPLSFHTATRRVDWGLATMIRLRPGASADEAATQMKAVMSTVALPIDRNADPYNVKLWPVTNQSPMRSVGIALLWLSSLVLLAACANLANMLYVRGAHRRAELAVRQSLGASTSRIFQLLLVESGMIGAAATLIGLVLAITATRSFATAFPLFSDRATRLTIDLTPDYFVFGYAFAAGIGAALIVGVTSAWRASRVPPLRAMAGGDAATSVTRTSRRTRLALVALQVATAVVLLMAAGLFFQQSRPAFRGRLTFETKRLATARIDLARHDYTLQSGHAFFRRLLDQIGALPGIERASMSDGIPGGSYMGGAGVTFAAERLDLPATRYIKPSNPRVNGTLFTASPGFLDTIGIPMISGRAFAASDADGADLVVIVSRSLAERLWPSGSALGKRLMFGNDGHWRRVVGICGDPVVARDDLGPKDFSGAHIVLSPYEQRYPRDPAAAIAEARAKGGSLAAALDRQSHLPREMLIVIRANEARGQLDAVRAAVTALDERVAVFDAATVDESVLAWAAPVRAARLLMGSLGIVALTIATLGIYSVVSFLVARRRREFGIRMALGARRPQVVKIVMDEAIHLMLVGLFAGVFVSVLGERLISNQRLGLQPNEIWMWAVVLVLILTVGLVAAFIPARRAAGIDPNVALRDL